MSAAQGASTDAGSEGGPGPHTPAGMLKPLPRWARILWPCIALPASLFGRAYWGSLRWSVEGEERVAPLLAGGRALLPCVWHQRQVVVLGYLLRLRTRGLRPGALVSPSRDGELIARTLLRMGVGTVRGSGRRSGALALRNMYRAIEESGLSPLIAPDGSTGPLHEFKPGAVLLARLSGLPVVPMSFSCRAGITLPTWDRLLLPLPFSKVRLVVGEPIELAPALSLSESNETLTDMGAALTAVEQRADELSGRCWTAAPVDESQ